MNSKRKVILNFATSTIATLLTMALGFVLPRIIMTRWGSEYNGLINSVKTIMNYLLLLEAGINTSSLQALYKSIGENDEHQTSVVVRSSEIYYRRVSIVYFLCVVAASFIYPLIVKSTISYWEIFFVIFLQGCSGVINFAFRAAYQQLLNAEGKYYVICLITSLTQILTFAGKVIAILLFNDIIVMQLVGVIVMAVQILIYAIYFHKKYRWINHKVQANMALLQNRKYYMVQQIGGLVFNSTDTFVLSIFCGLKVASVYTVYSTVYSALSSVISILRSSTGFVLGQSYYQGEESFKKTYRAYTSAQVMVGSILASVSMLLITSFVSMYTSGVTDIDYQNYLAAILFAFNIILDCSRGASLSAANVAGQAPKTTWRYLVEAGINLAVSLVLVQFWGIVGVLVGTIAAGLWRSLDSILFFSKHVLHEKPHKELLFIFLNIVIFGGFVLVGKMNWLPIENYLQFILWGIICVIGAAIIYGCLFLLMNRKNAKTLYENLRHKKKIAKKEDSPITSPESSKVPPRESESLSNCNFAKMVLMISIVLAHSTLFWGGDWFTALPCAETLSVLPQIGKWLFSFNIYCFALISGYIFYYLRQERNAYQNYGSFLWKKAKRLLIPYFFVTIVWIIPIAIFFRDYGIKEIFNYYLLGTSGEQLWFLLMLFWVFAFFYPLSRFIDKHPFLGLFISLAFYGVGLIGGHFLPNYYQFFTGCDYVIFFYIGFVIRKYGLAKLKKVPALVYIAVQIAFFVGFYFYNQAGLKGYIFKGIGIAVEFLLHSFGAVAAFVVLEKLANRVKWKNDVTQFIADRSMTVYLFHQQIIFFMLYKLNGLASPYVIALLSFGASFGLSLVISTALLKWNPTRFLVGEKMLKSGNDTALPVNKPAGQ